MAISSINIKLSTPNAFAHNDRTTKVNYVIDDKNLNEFDKTSQEAELYYHRLKEEAINNYVNRTKQKIQTEEERFRWTAVVNLNAHHTLEDVKNLAASLEDKYKWQPIQVAIHKDEGHINDKGEKVKNYHAHLEFFMLDKNGIYTMKKKDFRLKQMSELQTFVADNLKMDRGVSKKVSGKERLEHKEYKAVKQAEQKQALELIKTKEEANQIKAEFEAFRQEMIKAGTHNKEDYKSLSEAKKEALSKGVDFKEAFKILEQVKSNLQQVREDNLTTKIIEASKVKTLTGKKIDENLLKENMNIVLKGMSDLSHSSENLLDRMMRGIKSLYTKAKRIITKQRDKIHSLTKRVKSLESELKELKKEKIAEFKELEAKRDNFIEKIKSDKLEAKKESKKESEKDKKVESDNTLSRVRRM